MALLVLVQSQDPNEEDANFQNELANEEITTSNPKDEQNDPIEENANLTTELASKNSLIAKLTAERKE